MRECANIFIIGAGLYSWFSTYARDCIDQHVYQKLLVLLQDNHAGVRIQHLIAIGAKCMAVMDSKAIPALDYLNVESHPRWSQVSVLDVASDGELAELLWTDLKIWDMEQPAFTCVPPCLVAIPPWTRLRGSLSTRASLLPTAPGLLPLLLEDRSSDLWIVLDFEEQGGSGSL
ncbi:hypothetical protein MMYC01_209619 [Madurella mycetomatis]|uniref:Uncharacterized protein n=1 Tax=Madurella mycetomatis TaxID=100816 RepID=A0A175VUJ6_9PEZI|nr:hypothetical protein MMYC01_209619 [Madurella mycetomatis]